ncbi:uncharacterized protein LOC133895280 isoform X3 [Phragmites australis]|uniref:uncharacterized protein LOC133895280 isoform X3 n=1 Tax=Phragmites australis TaxID=29695 RepID=UPI002D772073|nr:uncharacterized protein LOC133895280 isoform X3 [Phragmites australis]
MGSPSGHQRPSCRDPLRPRAPRRRRIKVAPCQHGESSSLTASGLWHFKRAAGAIGPPSSLAEPSFSTRPATTRSPSAAESPTRSPSFDEQEGPAPVRLLLHHPGHGVAFLLISVAPLSRKLTVVCLGRRAPRRGCLLLALVRSLLLTGHVDAGMEEKAKFPPSCGPSSSSVPQPSLIYSMVSSVWSRRSHGNFGTFVLIQEGMFITWHLKDSFTQTDFIDLSLCTAILKSRGVKNFLYKAVSTINKRISQIYNIYAVFVSSVNPEG